MSEKDTVKFSRRQFENTGGSNLSLPQIKLDFLFHLTDDTGILQHSTFGIPKRLEGYTTDDNARALIACIKYCHTLGSDPQIEKLIDTYLGFLLHMQREDGKMRNFLTYDRRFIDDEGSEDCMGRTLWACGTVINSVIPKEKKLLSKEIFDRLFLHVSSFKSLRAIAFSLLGLCQYCQAYPKDQNLFSSVKYLANKLKNYYNDVSTSDWSWFEEYLTYANGRIPQALFDSYKITNIDDYLCVAEESYKFIIKIQMENKTFVPIGNKGWYFKGQNRAIYDQQSVEASCMVDSSLSAFEATKKDEYYNLARRIFEWFLGRNSLRVTVYNEENGGCYDGINPKGLNLNEGAEATVCYLIARLELEKQIF